jgi:hypothetical protein
MLVRLIQTEIGAAIVLIFGRRIAKIEGSPFGHFSVHITQGLSSDWVSSFVMLLNTGMNNSDIPQFSGYRLAFLYDFGRWLARQAIWLLSN